MTPQEAHNFAQNALTEHFLEHGVFPADLEVPIAVVWGVVRWAMDNRIPLQYVSNNRKVPIVAFYGTRLIPAQDLSQQLVKSLVLEKRVVS
jgi:hypothetical protein